MIRSATIADLQAITDIYNHYIGHSVATFEEEIVNVNDIAARFNALKALSMPWLVAELDGEIQGYAYAGPWKQRSAYRFTVETTVYLAPESQGRGLGTQLYEQLFERLQQQGIQVALGCITLPNPASEALHEKLGMKKVAHFERVGFKFGKKLDVGYWQKELL